MNQPKIVSRREWLEAREALLAKEKEMSRQRDALAAERRTLPWEKVDKTYVFDGPSGSETLSDLFGDASQLFVWHFMFAPEWKEACVSCSLVADHVGGLLPHLAARDVSFALVSRATVPQLEAFKKRMGWTMKWVSSNRNDFNWDYQVSFSKEALDRGTVHYNYKDQKYPEQWPSEEAPGISVFTKNERGEIFHTYSSFGRGGESIMGLYQFLDLVPKGRDEDGLPYPMAWVRHHDRYDRKTAHPNLAERQAEHRRSE